MADVTTDVAGKLRMCGVYSERSHPPLARLMADVRHAGPTSAGTSSVRMLLVLLFPVPIKCLIFFIYMARNNVSFHSSSARKCCSSLRSNSADVCSHKASEMSLSIGPRHHQKPFLATTWKLGARSAVGWHTIGAERPSSIPRPSPFLGMSIRSSQRVLPKPTRFSGQSVCDFYWIIRVRP